MAQHRRTLARFAADSGMNARWCARGGPANSSPCAFPRRPKARDLRQPPKANSARNENFVSALGSGRRNALLTAFEDRSDKKLLRFERKTMNQFERNEMRSVFLSLLCCSLLAIPAAAGNVTV